MGSDADELKRKAAEAALRHVESGMMLGLGTGSTAAIFVELLADAISEGTIQHIEAVCTSRATEELARRRGVTIHEFNDIDHVDLAIDGADEIDPQLRLIKGRGAALLREKIVEQSAEQFIVVADESKLVERLGVGVLPVEVVRFSSKHLLRRLHDEEVEARLRFDDGAILVTDEGHHIIDVMVPENRDIADFVADLSSRAGVVETGFFPSEASFAIIAGRAGVTTRTRK